jgi:hypothetical protein
MNGAIMNETQKAAKIDDVTQQVLPSLSFRVGVTGTRSLPSGDSLEFVKTQVREILGSIRGEIATLSGHAHAPRLYAPVAEDHVKVNLRIVSALAEGADCLVAQEAIDQGYELFAPLPFQIGDYENDFTHDLETFRRLAAQGHVVELDGDRGDNETASYEAAGRFVAGNCDLLIAIWDGKPARGRGGTAEIVEFAALSDLPIWWIDLEEKTTRFIANAWDWTHIGTVASGSLAMTALKDYLAQIILLPEFAYPHRTGLLGKMTYFFCRRRGYNPHPIHTYREEQIPPSNMILWRTYSLFVKTIAPPVASTSIAMIEAETPAEIFWQEHYRRADRLSIAYANRYRSSYVLILLFALSAFIISISGHHLRDDLKTALELAMLIPVAYFVITNYLYCWLERWIDYRLLAELCRKQIMLAPVGRTLPGAQINRMAQDIEIDSDTNPALPRELWVSRYFLALVRNAPYPERDIRVGKKRAFALGRSLVDEQIDYHKKREYQAEKADDRLIFLGDLSFIITLVVLTVSIPFFFFKGQFSLSESLEIMTWTFSGISAAFVALRAYAEFALIARQSRRMRVIMNETSIKLVNLDLTLPLSSQALGTTLHRLAVLMMEEVGGWAQIFRLKSVESH